MISIDCNSDTTCVAVRSWVRSDYENGRRYGVILAGLIVTQTQTWMLGRKRCARLISWRRHRPRPARHRAPVHRLRDRECYRPDCALTKMRSPMLLQLLLVMVRTKKYEIQQPSRQLQ